MGPGVQNILAAGLTGAIFQSMKEHGVWIKYLFTEPDAPGDPIRSIIRENKIGALSTYIDRTAVRLATAAAGANNPGGQPSASLGAKKP
jgi:hypothetical protein